MAEHSFPFDAVEDAYGEPDRVFYAEDFRRVFQAFFTNGLLPNPSDNLQVMSNGDGMSVMVMAGVAHVNGVTHTDDEPTIFAIDTANANYNRLDLIVVSLNEPDRTCKLLYRPGIPSGNPQEPELRRTSDIWELKLAVITVRSGTQQITQADILDTRLNSEVCGIVEAIPDQVDTTTIFNQYKNAWEQVEKTIRQDKANYDRWYTAFTEEAEQLYQTRINNFDAWFLDNKTSIFDAKYFDFENWAYRAGETIQTIRNSDGSVATRLVSGLDGSIIAEKVTMRQTDGSVVETLISEKNNISVKKTTMRNSDGSITEVIEEVS